MGLDYSFNLHFRRDQVWSVLQAVAAFAACDQSMDVVFPDGRTLTLPFESSEDALGYSRGYECMSAPLYLREGFPRLRLDTVLYFDADDAIVSYFEKEVPLELGRYRIGLIYLTIYLGDAEGYPPDEAVFSFGAATTDMSLLFDASTSIRHTFVKLAAEQHGNCCLLNREGDCIVWYLDGVEMAVPIDDASCSPLDEIRWEVRASKIGQRLLQRLSNEPTHQVLHQEMRSAHPEVRGAGLRESSLFSPNGFEVLIEALNDNSAEVREYAAIKLARYGHDRACPALIEALDDPDERVRRAACHALATFRDKRSVAPLLKWLDESNQAIRGAAARALGTIGDKRAVEPLISLLTDREYDVRLAAIVSLGTLRDERAVRPLIAGWEHEDTGHGHFILVALGEIGNSRAIPFLENILRSATLKDCCTSEAGDAATALGKIGGVEAKAILRWAAEEVNPSYRYCFDDALRWALCEELRTQPPKGNRHMTDPE